MINMALHYLGNSEQLQYALSVAGTKTKGGFAEIIKALEEAGGDLSGVATAFKKRFGKEGEGDTKPPPTMVHMGGGNTFNIKQDFRDQDPDRIAIIFQRDLIRAAFSPRQSRSPSGLG